MSRHSYTRWTPTHVGIIDPVTSHESPQTPHTRAPKAPNELARHARSRAPEGQETGVWRRSLRACSSPSSFARRDTRGRVVRVVFATDGPLSWCSLGVLTRARACWRVVRSRRALQHARECTCRCSRARTRFGRRASRGPDVASGATKRGFAAGDSAARLRRRWDDDTRRTSIERVGSDEWRRSIVCARRSVRTRRREYSPRAEAFGRFLARRALQEKIIARRTRPRVGKYQNE